MLYCLMWQHVLGLLIGEEDLVNGVSAVLEGNVVAVNVRREEDLGIPGKALAGGKVGDQPRRAVRLADVNDGAFLLGERRAQEARAAVVQGLVLAGRRRG